jgi:hypothetical protein
MSGYDPKRTCGNRIWPNKIEIMTDAHEGAARHVQSEWPLPSEFVSGVLGPAAHLFHSGFYGMLRKTFPTSNDEVRNRRAR